MRASRQQAKAAGEQVALMRADAKEEREHRDAEDSRREEEQATRDQAVRDQLDALASITEATRDAARAQLQPIVFAHATTGAWVSGPDDQLDLSEGDIAFPYYLSNEGTGLAMNIRHGVEVGGVSYEFGEGMEIRALRPGESAPPVDYGTKVLVVRPFTVVRQEQTLPSAWRELARTYWAKFENVFGEQFETRNPNDPRQSAAFMRLRELPIAPG